jgi:hypothetical protein
MLRSKLHFEYHYVASVVLTSSLLLLPATAATKNDRLGLLVLVFDKNTVVFASTIEVMFILIKTIVLNQY